MRYGGVGSRGIAFILDTILFVVALYVIGLITGLSNSTGFAIQGATIQAVGIPSVVTLFLWFLYFIVMEATVGATLGKMVMGLRVVQPDGCPIGWGQSLVRNILRIIDGLFFYLIGAILIWDSAKRQRLGDRLAGTVVARESVAELQRACEAQIHAAQGI